MKDIVREWVEYLKHHGESDWSAMPLMKNGKTVNHVLWKSWVRKGYISTDSRDMRRRFRLPDQS